MTAGRILIVDDDTAFVELYQELLEGEGHQVRVANTTEQATATLEASGADFDVVLIDQKLQGPGGPDTGLELLARARQLAPLAKSIIVTGYSSPEAIERAFAQGVYDYLVKNGAFEALLKAKVRNAVEVTSERRLAALNPSQRSQAINACWAGCQVEQNRNRKGALLEELVKLLFMSTPGFESVSTRLRTESEEVDVVVQNAATSSPWTGDGQYLLAECKNWSSRVDAAELRNFLGKFENKFRRARTGFFISVGGFTAGYVETLKERRSSDVLIISIDRAALQRWIDAEDRLLYLSELHQHAALGQ